MVFSLYSSVSILVFLLFDSNWLTLISSIFIVIFSVYIAKKTHAQTYSLQLSDSGEVKLNAKDGTTLIGKISPRSFYNGLCIYLYVENNATELGYLLGSKKGDKKLLVVYKDAVTKQQYRLLARIINTGLS